MPSMPSMLSMLSMPSMSERFLTLEKYTKYGPSEHSAPIEQLQCALMELNGNAETLRREGPSVLTPQFKLDKAVCSTGLTDPLRLDEAVHIWQHLARSLQDLRAALEEENWDLLQKSHEDGKRRYS